MARFDYRMLAGYAAVTRTFGSDTSFDESHLQASMRRSSPLAGRRPRPGRCLPR